VMLLPSNSRCSRRSKSTRRDPSSDSPTECSMNPPPCQTQRIDIHGRLGRFVQLYCGSSGKSGSIGCTDLSRINAGTHR
jgi:hypothetical protein